MPKKPENNAKDVQDFVDSLGKVTDLVTFVGKLEAAIDPDGPLGSIYQHPERADNPCCMAFDSQQLAAPSQSIRGDVRLCLLELLGCRECHHRPDRDRGTAAAISRPVMRDAEKISGVRAHG